MDFVAWNPSPRLGSPGDFCVGGLLKPCLSLLPRPVLGSLTCSLLGILEKVVPRQEWPLFQIVKSA